MLLGRGVGTDIQLPGPLVSRRHAELRETEAGLIVSDLGSRNGVFINGYPINESTLLANGDRLTLGEHTFVLVELRPDSPSEKQATTESSRRPVSGVSNDPPPALRRGEVLERLGSVVDKALALGQVQAAEHAIGTHLVATLTDATRGRGVAPEVARSTAQYAVKLGAATGKGAWLDFAFRLYSALDETIPLPIVDEMYTVIGRVRGLDREILQNYVQSLHARAYRSSASDRFIAERLEGLERLAAWRSPG